MTMIFLVTLIFLLYLKTIATIQQLSRPVVVVGAGPVGLASALMLNKRGYRNITILERRPESSFESERAYLYLIDGRGQRFTDSLGITDLIARQAVSSQNFQNITEYLTSGIIRTRNIPVDSNAIEKYWIPRSALLDILTNAVKKVGDEIKVVHDADCSQISVSEDGSFSIHASVRGSATLSLDTSFLLGCDGMSSVVREWLEYNCSDGQFDSDQETKKSFSLKRFQSDSSGLQYKMLLLKPNFVLKRESGAALYSIPEQAYAIRSTGKRDVDRLSLGLLPVKSGVKRTANIICKPNHKIWGMKTAQQLREFLSASFPQLNIDDITTEVELERFSSAKPGRFPMPQYCEDFYFIPKGKKSGAVLLGDSIHAFPPDLGQGVNSGLEDVYELNIALQSENDCLPRALPLFENRRKPESLALCQLMRFAYPYQYNQYPLRAKFYLLNFAARLLLNKAVPKLFSAPAFFLIQNHNFSYADILRMAHRTTKRLALLGIFALLSLFSPVLKLTCTRLFSTQ